jgi:predicted transcriptional regulator
MAKHKGNITKKKAITTHLPEDIVKDIKLIAVQKDKKNYEIIEEALRNYIKNEKMRRKN